MSCRSHVLPESCPAGVMSCRSHVPPESFLDRRRARSLVAGRCPQELLPGVCRHVARCSRCQAVLQAAASGNDGPVRRCTTGQRRRPWARAGGPCWYAGRGPIRRGLDHQRAPRRAARSPGSARRRGGSRTHRGLRSRLQRRRSWLPRSPCSVAPPSEPVKVTQVEARTGCGPPRPYLPSRPTLRSSKVASSEPQPRRLPVDGVTFHRTPLPLSTSRRPVLEFMPVPRY
jgi:hypothetical protein